MPAKKISISAAKPDKLFYFVANAIIYRESDQRCLILKRHERETTHPGKYGVIGGKLEWKDLDVNHPTRINGDVLDYEHVVVELLQREAHEEAGVEIYPEIKYLTTLAFIRPDEVPVIFSKFAARYKSGDITLEEGGFTDYAWVTADEVKGYDCIDGIHEEVMQTIALFTHKD